MSNVTFKPSISVGTEFVSASFPWPKDDLAEFNAVRKQFEQGQALVTKLQADVDKAKQAERAAHSAIIASPSADAVAVAQTARRDLASAEQQLQVSSKLIESSLNELVRNRLGPVATRLNKAIADWIIQESRTVEAAEQALVGKFNASGYVPSELLRALIHRAGSFYTAAETIQKAANIGSRSCTPSSALNGVIAPELKTK